MSECPLVLVSGTCSEKIEQWRREYNYFRTHSSLNNLNLAEFARSHQLGPALRFSLVRIFAFIPQLRGSYIR